MFVFWIIIALFVLLALWFVTPPLFAADVDKPDDDLRATNVSIYQDQYQEMERDLRDGLIAPDDYQREKDELERRLLEDVNTTKTASGKSPARPNRQLAYAVVAAIPIGAIAVYLTVGNPKAISAPPASPLAGSPAADQRPPMTQEQIAANVDKLAKRLQQNPNDLQGWLMLGRSYAQMDRLSDAAAALDHALQLDPTNQDALIMAGIANYELRNYQKAVEYWQKLPQNSEYARSIADQLAKAKQLAAGQTSR